MSGREESDNVAIDARAATIVFRGIGERLQRDCVVEAHYPATLQNLLDELRRQEQQPDPLIHLRAANFD